uniref:uncharacterized protein LOC120328288 n=1 Tax=Styela clava TaxID=7725 RepID=UPI00193A610E|nr:uncharacterized protein LOC120328288 [Styela clava]
MKRCYNPTTCMGTWTEQTAGVCSVTCGAGILKINQTCRLKSYLSTNCPGTNGTKPSRTIQQQCYNCQTWNNWTEYTPCNSSCTRVKNRTCQTQKSSACGNSSAVEIKLEPCSNGPCSLPSHTFQPESSSLYSYLTYIGGAAGFLLLVLIIAITVKSRQNEKQPEQEEKSERVYITEIDQISPTTGRRRHSFGSHYENLDGNVYADPDEMLTVKQKIERHLTTKIKKELKSIDNTISLEKVKTASPYSMAEDTEASNAKSPTFNHLHWLDSNQNFDVDDSDSFEDDDDDYDVNEQGLPQVATYETINYAEVNADAKKKGAKEYAKVNRKKKKNRDKKDKTKQQLKLAGLDVDQPSPYYESAFTNRGFVDPFTPPVSPISPLQRSTTTKNDKRPKKALMPKRNTVNPKVRTRGQSMIDSESNSKCTQRDRSITAPVEPVFTPPTSPTNNQVNYTDMAGNTLQNTQYTDMSVQKTRNPMVNAVSYSDMSRGYTDMTSSTSMQVPDAYSFGNERP